MQIFPRSVILLCGEVKRYREHAEASVQKVANAHRLKPLELLKPYGTSSTSIENLSSIFHYITVATIPFLKQFPTSRTPRAASPKSML
jgi:hypothetical protein